MPRTGGRHPRKKRCGMGTGLQDLLVLVGGLMEVRDLVTAVNDSE